ncbi:hypothetical protein GGR57DRAFT_247770 [Xylariaceae sp. FL1272]|nr:hypothetical protein GGR57DRAFT_247770 [Xylariaceae sp. FL1272]
MPNSSINDGAHGSIPIITPTQLCILTSFMSISLWIALELHVQIFRVFMAYRGLYFWSLLVLAWGIVLHCLGYLLNWFAPGCPWWLYALISAIGWSMLVTGESLVLYSRMHLVSRSRRILRIVLGMIVFTALFVQVPNWVTSIPAVDRDLAVSAHWSPRDSIETRIQLFAFLAQEATISSLYIWFTGRLLKPSLRVRERRVVLDLVVVNAIVIITDVVALAFAFTNQHVLKQPLQNLSYALKLKFEFVVLNQLTSLSRDGSGLSGCRQQQQAAGARNRYLVQGNCKDNDSTAVDIEPTTMATPHANDNWNASRRGEYGCEGSQDSGSWPPISHQVFPTGITAGLTSPRRPDMVYTGSDDFHRSKGTSFVQNASKTRATSQPEVTAGSWLRISSYDANMGSQQGKVNGGWIE